MALLSIFYFMRANLQMGSMEVQAEVKHSHMSHMSHMWGYPLK